MNSEFCVSPKVTDLPYIAQPYVIVKYCIVLQRLLLAYISYFKALFLRGPLCFGLMAHLSVKRLPVHASTCRHLVAAVLFSLVQFLLLC